MLRPGLSSPGQTSLAKGLHPDGCICCAWPVPFAADNILMSALAGGPWISRCPHPSTAQHPCSWGPPCAAPELAHSSAAGMVRSYMVP